MNLLIKNIVKRYNLPTRGTLGVKGAGCKLFPRLRRGFGGQVNSPTLTKKN